MHAKIGRTGLALSIFLGLSLATGRTGPRAEPAQEIELLHQIPTTIEVSSAVRNSTDKPEHLVDGSYQTAWSSRSGDLVGAWLTIEVPTEVNVKRILMNVGFTHSDRRGDFFTMKHRITKVAVYAEDVLIGHFPLDPNIRTLQTLPIDLPSRHTGGVFRILIEETLPGSKPGWRELCISELQVWGTVVRRDKPVWRRR